MTRKSDHVPLPKSLEETIAQAELEMARAEAEFQLSHRARITSKYVNLAGDHRDLSPYDQALIDGSHDYDPDAIYTRSTNKFDHSSVVHTPYPRQVIAMVRQVVSSRLIPEYRTEHDFIRNAVIHALHREASRFDTMPHALTIERMAAWVDQQEAEVANLDRITEDYVNRMRAYRERERWEALEGLIAKAETVADQFGGEWGDALHEEIHRANVAITTAKRHTRTSDD